jgi:mono/diheme cytochrome c family protein
MHKNSRMRPCFSFLLILLLSCSSHAQSFLTEAYPERITDPEAAARGKALYTVYGCTFCHGEDTRGGNGGPSLLRSQLVQRDEAGELIGPVLRAGVPNTTMVGFPLEASEVADIAEFLHSFELSSRDPSRQRPATIVTGNRRQGQRYFNEHCSGCHSEEGDLRDIANRFPEPRALQQNWLMPRNAPAISARVTTSDGTGVAGTLVRIDEFSISLSLADGSQRSFVRNGTEPTVVIDDPLAEHKALLRVYTDPDIHNVTAFLVTLNEGARR